MKIILLNPYFRYIDNFQGYMKNIGSILPPLGLAILANILRIDGHDVIIIDGWVENLTKKDLVCKIKSNSPEIVGIYTNTSSFYYAHKIIENLRETMENVTIIAGGPHATVIPKKTMEDCPELDFVVIGEGELILPKLIQKIQVLKENIKKVETIDNKNIRYWDQEFKEIKGISFRNSANKEIILTDPAPFIENLDENPLPAWDLLDLEKYRPSRANYYKLPSYTLITTRGCPYNCSFCSKPMGKKVRFMSANRVFEEVKYLYDEYHAKEIIFEDDCFTIKKKRNYELFRLLKENKIDVKWSCLTRVDIIDREQLSIMKKNNCWRVGYGVESGNEFILSKMQKGFTKQRLIDVFRLTKKIGINIRAFFILGNLYDTPETIRQTIDFAKKLNPDLAQFSYFVPFPGTQDYAYAVNHNLIDPNYFLKKPLSDYHYLKKLVFIPPGLTELELKNYQNKALREFYLRPKFILSQLRYLSNLDIFKRDIEIAYDLISSLFRRNNKDSSK